MKILLMSHSGHVTGGAEQCLLEYVDVLLREGHKCKVMVPYKGEMTKVLSSKNIPWVVVGYGWAIKPHRKVNAFKIMASTGNSLTRIFSEVEKYKPNLIVTNTAVIPWGLYAGRTFGIPTVLLVHEILSEKDSSLKVMPNYHKYGEILSANTDYVIYNSEFVKSEFKDILKLPKTSKDILYPLPPLDEAKIRQLFRENEIDHTLKIAIFGAISPRKNQLEALRAAKILREQGISNFTIDLYGDTSADPRYTKELRSFIRTNSLSKQIKIRGFATNVYEKMNDYNVVVSAATYEPFGRTIIEGQLFGRIVVTNNTGGGLELVRDSDTGLIYTLGSAEELAEKIRWILDNAQAALTLGSKAKKEQFEKYITASRYDALLEAVNHFSDHKAQSNDDNIFDPLMDLFQYNHQLNHKYRHLYRLTHNRVTYGAKGLVRPVLASTKKTLKKYI